MRIAKIGIVLAAMIFLTLAGAQAQTFTLLHQFQGNRDGTLPHGALLRDAAGNLYGTTYTGANHNCQGGGCGSVFKLSATGNETMLHRFIQTDGALPNANPHPRQVRHLLRHSGLRWFPCVWGKWLWRYFQPG